MLVLWGVSVNVLPEAQNEYFNVASAVRTLPEVSYEPLAEASGDTKPIPPTWLIVVEQSHPPLAIGVQVTDAKPSAVRTLAAPEQVVGVDEMMRHDASNVNFS